MISSSTKDCIDAEVSLNCKQELFENFKSNEKQTINQTKTQVFKFTDSKIIDQACLNALKADKNSKEIKPQTIKFKLDLTNIVNEELHVCRICLGNDQAKNLIYPCKCTGSQKYVHEECLKTWLLSKNDEDLYHCEVCKNTFSINFQVMSICLPFGVKTICKAWIPLFISVILLITIIYIAYLAISTKSNDAYIIICAIILGFGFVICCLFGLIFSFTVCFERKIEVCKLEEN